MPSRNTVLYLVPIGDIHYGTKNCDEDKLIEIIKWVKDTPNAYTILMGDLCEFINKNDKRFDSSVLNPICRQYMDDLSHTQVRQIAKMLYPIRDKIIGALEGNHEDVFRRRADFNPVEALIERLNNPPMERPIPNLTYNAFIRWHIIRQENTTNLLVIYASHGFGAGRYAGGKVNNLLNLARDFEADIYLVAHVHEKIGIDREKLYITRQDEPRVVARKKIFAITGCFLKVYEQDSRSYGERKMYPPTPTGVVKIRIEPFRNTHINGKAVECPPHLHISE